MQIETDFSPSPHAICIIHDNLHLIFPFMENPYIKIPVHIANVDDIKATGQVGKFKLTLFIARIHEII